MGIMLAMERGLGGLSGLPNKFPMMPGEGPFGAIEMGGMFTIVKIRDKVAGYDDPGWYRHPEGTVAWRVG